MRRTSILLLAVLLLGCPGPASSRNKPERETRVSVGDQQNTPAQNVRATLPTGIRVSPRAPGQPSSVSLDPLGPPTVKLEEPEPADPPFVASNLTAENAFNRPTGLAILANGDLVVADHDNHAIKQVAADGSVTTLAGGEAGFADGELAAARFRGPTSVATAPDGAIFVTDTGNHRIRMIKDGQVSTLAGSDAIGNSDAKAGPGASFVLPVGLAYDGRGKLAVGDGSANRIRLVDLNDPDHAVSTLAGNGDPIAKDGEPRAASFGSPAGLAYGADGTLYVADVGGRRVRKVTSEKVTSLNPGPVGGKSTFQPLAVAPTAEGGLWVADLGNQRLLRVPQGDPPDTRLVAGDFNSPQAIAVAADGTIYVADTDNNRIRKLAPKGSTSDPAATADADASKPGVI